MKKDDALALREKLTAIAARTAEKGGFGPLAEDGKLFHDELDDVARWAVRLSLPGRWPHRLDLPGLRLEAWFFQGKPRPDEELLLALVLGDAEIAADLRPILAPVFKDLVEGGKYARRYRPLEPMVTRFYPGATGICRRAPVAMAKLEAAWAQLVTDTLKPVDAALAAWDPDGTRRAGLAEADAPDPLEALRKKFAK